MAEEEREERISVYEEMRAEVRPTPRRRALVDTQAQQRRRTSGRVLSIDETFIIDPEQKVFLVADPGGNPRMLAGLLQPNPEVYGLRLYDSSGNVVFEVADLVNTGEKGSPALSTDIEFSVSGISTVSWTSGSIWLQGETEGSGIPISSGSVVIGALNPKVYIYYDPTLSGGTLQTSPFLSAAFGTSAFLLAVATRATGSEQSASVHPVQGLPRLASSSLTVDVIDTIHLRSGSVTTDELNVQVLSGITDDAGIIVYGILQNADGNSWLDLEATSPPVWNASTIYSNGQEVAWRGERWESTSNGNQGEEPGTSGASWSLMGPVESFLEHPGMRLTADGSARFAGIVESSEFLTGEARFVPSRLHLHGFLIEPGQGFEGPATKLRNLNGAHLEMKTSRSTLFGGSDEPHHIEAHFNSSHTDRRFIVRSNGSLELRTEGAGVGDIVLAPDTSYNSEIAIERQTVGGASVNTAITTYLPVRVNGNMRYIPTHPPS